MYTQFVEKLTTVLTTERLQQYVQQSYEPNPLLVLQQVEDRVTSGNVQREAGNKKRKGRSVMDIAAAVEYNVDDPAGEGKHGGNGFSFGFSFAT